MKKKTIVPCCLAAGLLVGAVPGASAFNMNNMMSPNKWVNPNQWGGNNNRNSDRDDARGYRDQDYRDRGYYDNRGYENRGGPYQGYETANPGYGQSQQSVGNPGYQGRSRGGYGAPSQGGQYNSSQPRGMNNQKFEPGRSGGGMGSGSYRPTAPAAGGAGQPRYESNPQRGSYVTPAQRKGYATPTQGGSYGAPAQGGYPGSGGYPPPPAGYGPGYGAPAYGAPPPGY